MHKPTFALKFESELPSPGLLDDAGRLDGKIKSAEAFLTGETHKRYRRLVESHGADALAECDRGNCAECNVSLTNQMQVALNSGNLIFCSSCGRLMYLAPGARVGGGGSR